MKPAPKVAAVTDPPPSSAPPTRPRNTAATPKLVAEPAPAIVPAPAVEGWSATVSRIEENTRFLPWPLLHATSPSTGLLVVIALVALLLSATIVTARQRSTAGPRTSWLRFGGGRSPANSTLPPHDDIAARSSSPDTPDEVPVAEPSPLPSAADPVASPAPSSPPSDETAFAAAAPEAQPPTAEPEPPPIPPEVPRKAPDLSPRPPLDDNIDDAFDRLATPPPPPPRGSNPATNLALERSAAAERSVAWATVAEMRETAEALMGIVSQIVTDHVPDGALREVLVGDLASIADRLDGPELAIALATGRLDLVHPAYAQALVDLERARTLARIEHERQIALADASSQLPETLEDACEFLGINPRAGEAAAKRIVDALRLSWHPDRALDDADRISREIRIKQINAAWDLVRGRG